MPIQPLPPEVIAQIRSSVAITSLNDVVCELMKNCLDAQCTKIRISVNYNKGSCSVEDDGQGILPTEFHPEGGLGKLYHTSRSTNSSHHGFRGSFLASLAAVALTTITSHHNDYRSTNAIILHQSTVIARQIPCSSQAIHLDSTRGTKVVVHNLFGNMPVRIKQRANIAKSQNGHGKEWDQLRQRIVSLTLAWPLTLDLSLRNEENLERLMLKPASELRKSANPMQEIDISHVHRVLSLSSMVPVDEKSSWVRVNASAGVVTIDGAVSLVPSPIKIAQFISIGVRPIESTSPLHEEVNKLFAASDFGIEDGADGASKMTTDFKQRELKSGKKGIDRYPKFYLRLTVLSTTLTSSQRDISDFADAGILSNIIEMVHVMLSAFLEKYHFRQRNHRQPSKFSHKGLLETQDICSDQLSFDSSSATSSDPVKLLQAPGYVRSSSFNTQHPPPTYLASGAKSPQEIGSTRMRRGVGMKNDTRSKHPSSLHDRPQSAPPNSARRALTSDEQTSATNYLKITNKKGRLPFSDVTMFPGIKHGIDGRSNVNALSKNDSFLAAENLPLAEQADKQIWINPVTRTRSIVDVNTGRTMPLAIRHADLIHSQHFNRGHVLNPIQQDSGSTEQFKPVPSQWLANVLKTWNNPVYSPTEQGTPQICFEGAGRNSKKVLTGHTHVCNSIDIKRLFNEASDSTGGRISKDALRKSKVIAQLDKKYILVSVDGGDSDSILVIIDQHAADERVRIEYLLELFFTTSGDTNDLETEILTPPLNFELGSVELTLLTKHQAYFARWGIWYELATSTDISKKDTAHTTTVDALPNRLVINRLPSLIHERCRQEPRLLIHLIRTEIWKVVQENVSIPTSATLSNHKNGWLSALHTCPQGIIDMLNSRACRSAIMFNDTLSMSQCETLVKRLAECKFPFQCAHGRPSLIPLAKAGSLPLGLHDDQREKEECFGDQFQAWKRQKMG